MGSFYYYFVASLPQLFLDGKMPIDVKAFQEDCRRLLSEKDYTLMQRLWTPEEGEFSGTGNHVLDAWLTFERGFRNELAWERADHLNKDPMKYLRGPRTFLSTYLEDIQRALKMDDLLQAEETLSKARWRFLDELGTGHYYDLESLFIYYLKLTILQRYQEYRSSEGYNRLQEIKTMPLPESCTTASA
ncbi:MAG: DUF2764 family protein [Candidatus Omnitrophica bacterium]|nr:DUF2764 family protein [Candidatus Omnitrophota bacterium]